MADESIQICGRTEGLADSFRGEPWPQKQITYNVAPDGYTGTLPPSHIVSAFKEAWMDWADTIDIEPVEVPAESQAMVRSKLGVIDGSRQVLAWSELSDGTMTPKRQLYDNAENWSWEEEPQTQIDLQRVACHEIGHVLGLVHDDNGADALMAPIYNPQIRGPRPRDVARMQQLGYSLKPVVPPVEPPVTPPVEPPVIPVPPHGLDQDTVRRVIDAVFAGLRTAFANQPIMLFAINVCYSLAYAWMGLAPGGAAAPAGGQALAIDPAKVQKIIKFIFDLIKLWAGSTPELAVAIDQMRATALAQAHATAAELNA